ncbi:hypothetical protein RRG08_006309 [Elysia crispata]|uniref:Uncharacterized protein n=1 Tax=Elysia crispata TaxID=231223 RepID=A0AAE0YRK8_9GAST|nr:hypothetical protein RRG08_006309 [Elysia crispata]
MQWKHTLHSACTYSRLVLSTCSIKASLAVIVRPLHNSYVLGGRASMFAKSELCYVPLGGRSLCSGVGKNDDLDSWLLRFKLFATTSGWPKESWCTSLSALLTGRASEAFCRPSETEGTNYDHVKEVLQKRCNLTEDGYRQRFRSCSP